MNPHFRAQLTFAPDDDETTRSPVTSGYRAAIMFPFRQDSLIGIFNFTDVELAFPGDTVQAEITVPELGHFKIYEGMDFEFYENTRIVGQGVVTKVF